SCHQAQEAGQSDERFTASAAASAPPTATLVPSEDAVSQAIATSSVIPASSTYGTPRTWWPKRPHERKASADPKL
ncbi:hypothetical protein BGZ65_011800, partial [Modicella reniformis]